MSWKWISFGILCLVLLFQYKNISSFIAVELALKGFKELDVNSDDVIDKSYWPGIREQDLTPGYSGIRPKLQGERDFVVDSGSVSNNQYVNVLGYASPGLTSSLALAIEVSNRIELGLS